MAQPHKMNVQYKKPIPIIDLFAGPGGLGEGFSSVTDSLGRPAFRIGLSIEKEPSAHKTLTLRAVFRQLRGTPALEKYFRYVRGEIDEASFRAIPEVALPRKPRSFASNLNPVSMEGPYFFFSSSPLAFFFAVAGGARW